METKEITIRSIMNTYSVKFIDQINPLLNTLTKKHRIHLLIDQNIYNIYKLALNNSIKLASSVYSFQPLEKKKSLKEIYKFIDFLLEKKIQKDHKIVVIGGALVQDIGSFTSHIILRGIDWIFIPTTLLAMADSCIGSKSGINIGKFKNQVGSFHHPIHIYIYPAFLKTLPKNELLNGIGEIIKHLCIKGGSDFSKNINNLDLLGKNMQITNKIIYESLLIKKNIIEKDEFEEKEVRKLLNYGHTFGHAIEGHSNNKVSHGIAVLNGIDMANYISFKRNFLPENEFLNLHKIVKRYLPYKKVPISNMNLYLEFLSRDKKVVGQNVKALLCKGLGEIIVVKIALDKKLSQEITQYCHFYNQESLVN